MNTLRQALRTGFVDPAEPGHPETDAQVRRRRIVVAITLAVGALLLGESLAIKPGDSLFYPMTLAVAATWVGGGLLSGPLRLGRTALRRPVVTPIVTGLVIGALFVAGAAVVAQVPLLRDYVDAVLDHARYGSIPLILAVTLINGLAEEVFFRGALFAAIGRRHPVALSTGIYALATAATANPMLVFAAALLGFVLGLQRRASGGILASVLTHLTWSTVMLFVLPAVIGAGL